MSGSQPERFYHGFVLGLLVELRDRYYITSNRESGFRRYDVMLDLKIRILIVELFLNLRYLIREEKKILMIQQM